jgi:hypothetical protein
MGTANISGLLYGGALCASFVLSSLATAQDKQLLAQWHGCVQAKAGAYANGKDSETMIASAALEACSTERTRYGKSFPPHQNFDEIMQANMHMRDMEQRLLNQAQRTVLSVREASSRR